MPTVSEQLRQAREAQMLDIYQVAEITKIKTEHIRALEEGRYDAFTAPVYIRGFVRTYAKALKLDVPAILADLDVELGKTEKFREPPSLTGTHEGVLDSLMLFLSRLNWRVFVALGVIVLGAWLGTAWLRSRKAPAEDPLKKLGPGIYQPTQTQAGETLPIPAPPPPK